MSRHAFSGVVVFPILLLASGCILGSARPPLGVWVPAEGESRPLNSADETALLAERARESGITDLFVQVFRGGRAWWPSDQFERGPYAGLDPVADLIQRTRPHGIRVHAWINVYSLSTRPSAKALKRLPESAWTRDNLGRSVVAYSGESRESLEADIDSPGLWLDPASPDAQAFILAAVDELTARYPQLAGIHLDFVRYPYALPMKPAANLARGIEFGFGDAAIERFEKETGMEVPFQGVTGESARKFADWRREQITQLVHEIRKRTKKKMRLSAAVLAWQDRAYLSSFQDWRRWLEEGAIDFAVPMAYSRDDRFFRYLATSSMATRPPGEPPHARVWVGLGAWDIGADPDAFHTQLDIAAAVQPDGVVLFSYDNIAKSPALIEILRRWNRGESAPPPPGTPEEPKSLIDYIDWDQRQYRKQQEAERVKSGSPPSSHETRP
ncbi:MAG: family 10 glycosylhydrolase [Deltaproteobacteria bacterium]|nr:family 10 glycosylhydrolase [Deltaproteobacteria bacterium]